MANVTLAEVKAQASALSREERRRLVEELSRELQADEPSRPSITELFGKLGPVTDDVDARIRALRDEWDERA